MTAGTDRATVHFGGPDQARGILRDLLEERIHAVPAAGEITWATYYFRDLALAKALVRAKQRGVRVQIFADGAPRKSKANQRAFAKFEGPNGLSEHFHPIQAVHLLSEPVARPFQHCKIYVFSHPEPVVFLGSFDPAGNGEHDDNAKLLDAIGDQDRGHNLLVELRDPAIVDAMRKHIQLLPWLVWPPAARMLPRQQRVVEAKEFRAWFFPRRNTQVVRSLIDQIGAGRRLRVVASHIKTESGLRMLCDASERGVKVEVILDKSLRQTPEGDEAALKKAGVTVLRYRHALALPMQAKFMLIDRIDRADEHRYSTYGSLNLNQRSLESNHEVFVADRDHSVFEQLDHRWKLIEHECHAQVSAQSAAASSPLA